MSESAAVEKYKTGNQEAWVLIARLRWILNHTLASVRILGSTCQLEEVRIDFKEMINTFDCINSN